MAYENVKPTAYPLGQGMDSDGSPHLSDAPSLVKNGVFRRAGILDKRPGTAEVAATDKSSLVVVDGVLYGVGPGLSRLGDAEREIDATDADVRKELWDVGSEVLLGNGQTERFVEVDACESAGLVAFAWVRDDAGNNRTGISVVDKSGKGVISSLQVAFAVNARCPRVFWDGVQIRVVYLDSGTAKTRTVSTAGVISSESTVSGSPAFDATAAFDAAAFPYDGGWRYAIAGQDGTNLRVADSAGGTAVQAITTGLKAVSVVPWTDRDGVCSVAGIDSNATPVFSSEWDTAGATLGALSRDDTSGISGSPTAHSVGVSAVSATEVDVWHSWGKSTFPYERETRRYRKTTGVSVGPSDRLLVSRYGVLATKPFAASGNSRAWLSVGTRSGSSGASQDQRLLLHSIEQVSGAVATLQAAALPQLAYTYVTAKRLPSVIASGDSHSFGALRESGAWTSTLALVTASPGTFVPQAYRDGALIPGSLPREFHGGNWGMSGFNHAPLISAVDAGSGTALTSGKSYQYHACFIRVDERGNAWYGPFSDAVTLVSTGKDATITVTGHPPEYDDIKIAIFRTQGDGETFRALAQVSNPSAAYSATYTDATSDSGLTGAALSPWNVYAGYVDIPWPPHRVSGFARNRYWVADRDLENERVYYSRKVEPGISVGFDGSYVRIPYGGGRVTGLVEYQDKLLVLKERAIYIVDGDGPDDTGAGDSFREPYRWNASEGCINRFSLIAVGQSVFFLSASGIVELGSDMQLQPVGRQMSYYTDRIAVSWVTHNTVTDEIVWLTDGPALVYNTLYKAWSVWTGHEAASAAYDEAGILWYIDDAGKLRKSTTTWLDDTAWVELAVVTPWLSLAQLGGEKRVKSWQVLGWANSDAILSVAEGFNFDPEYQAPQVFQTRGKLLNFSADDLFSGADLGDTYARQAMLIRFSPAVTRATSTRFLIKDAPVVGHEGTGRGCSLSAIVIDAMAELGSARGDGVRNG